MMDENEWISWTEALKQHNLTSEELFALCDEGLPVYDSNKNPVAALSICKAVPVEQPRIIWGRIPIDSRYEQLDFGPSNTIEFGVLTFIGFPKTGDFVIVRKDCIPNTEDESLYRAITSCEFPDQVDSNFFRFILSASTQSQRSYIPDGKKTFPSMFNPISLQPPQIDGLHPSLKAFYSIHIKRSGIMLTPSITYSIPYKISNRLVASTADAQLTIQIAGLSKDRVKKAFANRNHPTNKHKKPPIDSLVYATHASISYHSDKGAETSGRSLSEAFWIQEKNGNAKITMYGMRKLELTIDRKTYPAPSIHAVAKALERYNFDLMDKTTQLREWSNIYLHASYLTYVSLRRHITPAPDSILFDFNIERQALAYPNESDIIKAMEEVASGFYFRKDGLGTFPSSVITLESFKQRIVQNLSNLVATQVEGNDKNALMALVLKLKHGMSHEKIHAEIMPDNTLGRTKDNQRVAVNRLLGHGGKIAKDNNLLSFYPSDWRKYNQKPWEFFLELAKKYDFAPTTSPIDENTILEKRCGKSSLTA